MLMGKLEGQPRSSLFGDGLPKGDRKGPWQFRGEVLSGAVTVHPAAGFQPGIPQHPLRVPAVHGCCFPRGTPLTLLADRLWINSWGFVSQM